MKKLTEKEIENLLRNCLNEGFSINIFESCKYYKNGINNLLESLTDEDFDKLLTEVNLDLDEYILHKAKDYYNAITKFTPTLLNTKPKQYILDSKLNLKLLYEINEINKIGKKNLAKYDPLSNSITLFILNDKGIVDYMSLALLSDKMFYDTIVHEFTHNIDFENILTNHIDALFGNNLRNNEEPENGVMEVNAFSTQLISALDKYVYMNFNKKIASIGKNATIEQLHSIIKQTLQEFINNEYNSNNVIIALSIFKRLSRKNKRKVIKHVYMYFTEQFLKSYPFFKPDL